MKLLIIITAVCLIVSLIANRQKTWIGIRKGITMFLNLLPVLLLMLGLVSVVLFLIPNETNKISSGDCVVVPHQADSRSIHADTDLEILAVQELK